MRGRPGETQLIFREEVRRSVRRKSYLVITLSVPALLLVILAVVPVIRAIAEGREEEEAKPIGIVNLSEDLSVAGEDPPGFRIIGGRQEGIDALTEDTIQELFVIPEGYLADGHVEWLHTGGDLFGGLEPGPSDASQASINALLRVALAEEDMPPELLARALSPAAFDRVRVGEDGQPVLEEEDKEFARFLASFVAAFLLLFSILIGGSALLQAVAEEKENRMIEVLLTSAKPLSIMAGKVFAIGATVLVQVVVWVGSILLIVPRIFGVFPDAPDFPVDPLIIVWVVAFFLAGYFFCAVILAALGAVSTGVREATQLSVVVMLPVASPMWALMELMSNPDGVLARVLSFIPLTAPMTMMVRLAVGDPPVWEALASLVITVLGGLALLWVSARVFRAGLLMYGQRMSLRGALAALREVG